MTSRSSTELHVLHGTVLHVLHGTVLHVWYVIASWCRTSSPRGVGHHRLVVSLLLVSSPLLRAQGRVFLLFLYSSEINEVSGVSDQNC